MIVFDVITVVYNAHCIFNVCQFSQYFLPVLDTIVSLRLFQVLFDLFPPS